MAGPGGGGCPAGGNDLQWCFSQVKGAVDEDVAEADVISTVEFSHSGDLLATGDKGGRVVIFQREQENKSRPHSRGEYNVYSTFQSHEPEFDYLKSLEIEEKINKIRWLPQQSAAHFLLSTNDDLRINLWHLEITDRSFNIVDIKPANMEELTEVITAAEFHPHQCNVLVYSSSKGTIRLCDMRSSALCDQHSKFFEEPEDPSSRSFFSEIISSVSDVKFSHSGRYMMTRDYLSVKVWDLNMESRPVETHQVHEYLRSKLCSLYENDCIFDKFECCWNGSDRSTYSCAWQCSHLGSTWPGAGEGSHSRVWSSGPGGRLRPCSAIMTGSYNNFFRMFDRTTWRDVTLEASRENSKPRASLKPRRVCAGGKRKKDEVSVDSLDFSKKILHTAWHPAENIIAVAATNNLYIFQDKAN
ncbi:serine/threonine-protein phosphatase 2A 55 kDa regulatory subunit B delta isoform isoform X10 [Kogia breviceps]|uniref:serine/threonine-protein phosphatase 2A 55 kDa regulatory subunit B delta isoform isoform X10 n=1 Tax=Kogia breviceps TaxID=27615 RepID=UPI0034D36001